MAKIALFLSALDGGGAERVMLYLGRGFAERGHEIDLVLAKPVGPLLSEIPESVNLVNLNKKRLVNSIPDLIGYLKQQQPVALLSALEDANVIALWSRYFAKVSTHIAVSVHNTMSQESQNATTFKRRFAPYLARWFYPMADTIITVSQGAAEDLLEMGFDRNKVKTIYNPVILPEFFQKIEEPLNHPWFTPGEPPVILGVGRLEKQKDFETLIRAFALVCQKFPAKLIILGEGGDRQKLEALIEELKLTEWVDLPGFVSNPYRFMARAHLFVLSSLFEGLPTALIEAMAAGTRVISTDCKSGPAEILNYGEYGRLVPIGDVEKMAIAIEESLKNPIASDILKQRGAEFSLAKSADEYLRVMDVC